MIGLVFVGNVGAVVLDRISYPLHRIYMLTKEEAYRTGDLVRQCDVRPLYVGA